MFFFFFFKQKTAYEMRISDWSSDVCSSDLDFDHYANGTWFRNTQIPGDQASAGVDYAVYNLTQRQLRALVTGAPATSQVGGLYQSFMDEARVEALGARPLMAELARGAAIPDRSELTRFTRSETHRVELERIRTCRH